MDDCHAATAQPQSDLTKEQKVYQAERSRFAKVVRFGSILMLIYIPLIRQG